MPPTAWSRPPPASWPRPVAPTPTRCSPTTWPTPRRRSRRPGRCSTTAPRASSRAPSPAPSWPTRSTTWSPKLFGREAELGRRPPARSTAPAPSSPPTATRASSPSLADHAGPAPPRRRLRDGAGHVPPLRRQRDRARSPSTSTATTPTSPRRSSPGLAEMGAFGLSVPERVRRLHRGRRGRVPRHGRRHRGAVPRLARHRRLAHHPARDPHPGAASRAAPRSRSSSGCRSWPPPR